MYSVHMLCWWRNITRTPNNFLYAVQVSVGEPFFLLLFFFPVLLSLLLLHSFSVILFRSFVHMRCVCDGCCCIKSTTSTRIGYLAEVMCMKSERDGEWDPVIMLLDVSIASGLHIYTAHTHWRMWFIVCMNFLIHFSRYHCAAVWFPIFYLSSVDMMRMTHILVLTNIRDMMHTHTLTGTWTQTERNTWTRVVSWWSCR